MEPADQEIGPDVYEIEHHFSMRPGSDKYIDTDIYEVSRLLIGYGLPTADSAGESYKKTSNRFLFLIP